MFLDLKKIKKDNLIKKLIIFLLFTIYILTLTLLSIFFFLIIIFFIKDLQIGLIKRFFPAGFSKQKDIIVHASSAGEAILAYNLFGNNVNYTFFNNGAYQIFEMKKVENNPLPFESIFSILLFLLKNRYSKIVFIEQEIWPGFLFINKLFNKKLILINCNMYEKSYKTQKKLKFLFSFFFSIFDEIVARSELDKGKLIELNDNLSVKSLDNFKILSSIKSLDYLKDKTLVFDQLYNSYKNNVFVFSSFHMQEYDLAIKIILKLKENENFKYIIAPRFIDTIKFLIDRLKKEDIKYKLLSQLLNNKMSISKEKNNDDEQFIDELMKELVNLNSNIIFNNEILIVDKFGVLPFIYKNCFVSIIGGSFNNKGGQNFIESLIQLTPVIVGPSYDNFVDLIDYFEGEWLYIASIYEDENKLIKILVEKILDFYKMDQTFLKKKLETKILQLKKIAEKQNDYILNLLS
ncbi:MAG: glycosyltransferase N-terminal domain-containing protein [Exilispira sp.]